MMDSVDSFDIPKCDVCGEPATVAVRDAIPIRPKPGDVFRRFKPGPAHYGCDAHRVKSKVLEEEDE